MRNITVKMLLAVAVIFAVMAFIPTPAKAGLAGAPLNISLNTIGACGVATNPIDLGLYYDNQPTNNVQTVGNAIQVTCTNAVVYTVDLDQGANWTLGPLSGRSLKDNGAGTTYLSYRLYWDAGQTQLAGTSVTGTASGGTGNGATQNISLTGVALAFQPVTLQATYSDTVIVTVSW